MVVWFENSCKSVVLKGFIVEVEKDMMSNALLFRGFMYDYSIIPIHHSQSCIGDS